MVTPSFNEGQVERDNIIHYNGNLKSALTCLKCLRIAYPLRANDFILRNLLE